MALPTQVCGRPLNEFLDTIQKFHGWKAPGVVIGGFMVDWALEEIPHGVEADAIVESRHCLPDAVQLFTPCTYGNGWLKVLDWDKYALCLYDKKTLRGVRIWLDLEKLRSYPQIHNWFMRLVPKKDLPLEVLLPVILEAGRSMLSCAPVEVTRLYGKQKKGETGLCPSCGEAYTLTQGPACLACQGEGYCVITR